MTTRGPCSGRKRYPMVTQLRLVEVFVELADTLVTEFDSIDFLHTLTDRCVEVLDADAAGLMLADHGKHLQLVAASTEEIRTIELFELQHDEGPCIDAYRQGEPVTNVDPATAQQRWPTFGAAVRAGNYTTVHAIPMRLRDQVLGAINLFLVRPGDLSDVDLQLARGLADIATIGLLHERATQHQHTLSEQLQGALNSRVVLEQAKGILVERHGVSLGQAFTAMRTHARRNNEPLTQIATHIIDGTLDKSLMSQQ